jgi:hypothetical protein
MPEKVKPSVAPSPGLLSRIFGNFGTSQMTPAMEEGVRIAQKENPNLAPVKPYGFFSKLLQSPQAQGYTSPWGGIYLNPQSMQGLSPQDVADTITHEQTHVGQIVSPTRELLNKFLPPSEPYYRRPEELAAFQAEKERRARMGRPQTAAPRFDTGSDYIPQDISLPSPKKR